MPVKIDPKDRKLLLGASVVFVLLIAGAALFGGPTGHSADIPSSYSIASGGAKAAYMLLAHDGYSVEHWERPLDALPDPPYGVLILADPNEAPTPLERARLKRYISQGGRVIATGMFAGMFLPENGSVPEILGSATWEKATALAPSAITRAAPQITLAPEASWQSFASAYRLYGHGERTLVVEYPYGKGRVLWWASATPLTNAGLKEPGNLEFFLACVGAEKGSVFWDEYVHGYRETLASSIVHSPVKWLALQLSLLAIAVVFTFSRRSGPICAPVAQSRTSPIEFVQTLGGLYEKAGSASVVVDICYQRFRYWLTRRLGTGSSLSTEDLLSAVRERWALNDDHFAGVIQRCDSARSDPYLQPPEALHLVRELDDYANRLGLYQGVRKEKR